MDDYSCIMCDDGDLETWNHLFFLCPFAHICWQYLCPTWVSPQFHDIQSIIQNLKALIKEPFFMEIIILTARSIGLHAMTIFSRVLLQAYTDSGRS
jgi:hypothetical protein